MPVFLLMMDKRGTLPAAVPQMEIKEGLIHDWLIQ
jgi:hypothetical protein